MGDTIRYPNMGTVKKAAEIYGLVNLDSLARYFEQGDPAESSQTADGIRRVAR